MAEQRRFWNWKDDDLTFDLSRAFIGLIDSGRYRGFEAQPFDTSMTITLGHTDSGTNRTKKDKTLSERYGVVVTKQGVIIQEENSPVFTIEPTDGSAFRKDLLVIEHTYEEVIGGQTAVYKVIKGTDNSLDFPTLTSPLTQVILGYLELPVNTSTLNTAGVVYTEATQPGFANHLPYITQENGFFTTNLDARVNRIINLENPIDPQDAATKFYVDEAIANNIVWSTEAARGIIEIANTAEAEAGTDNERAMTPLKSKQQIDARVATQVETNAGVDDSKLLTPRKLHNRTSSETQTGIARISTVAEALAGVDDTTIITPFKLKKALPLIPLVLDIGEWDMQAAQGINIIHGLGAEWIKVVSMQATIINDDQTLHLDLAGEAGTALRIDDTNVSLGVDAASGFNSTNYDQTGGFNRGFIVLWMKADVIAQTGLLIDAGVYTSQNYNFVEGSQSVVFTLNGFINSIGSPVDTILWEIITAPAGSVSSFIDDTIEDAEFQITHYGVYELRLTVTNVAGDIAIDTTTLQVVEQANNLPFISSVNYFNPVTGNPVSGYVQYNGTLNGTIKIKVNATDIDLDTLTAFAIPSTDAFISGGFGTSVNNGGTISSNLLLPDPYTYVIDPVDPSIITISGFTPPSAAGGFVGWIMGIDDGNGGQDKIQVKFKNLGPNTVGQENGGILLALSEFGPDASAFPSVYDGDFIHTLTPSFVAYAKVTIIGTGISAGSFDVLGKFGSTTYAAGVHTVPGAIANNVDVILRIMNVAVTSASMKVELFNSSDVLLSSAIKYVSQP